LEGYHSALNKHYDCSHPNPWTFLKQLDKLQTKIDVKIREYTEKGAPVKRKRVSADFQQNLCERYSEFKSLSFINEIVKTCD
jgi:hypothetical protein